MCAFASPTMEEALVLDMRTPETTDSDADGPSSAPKKKSKPEYSRFTQQELPAWKPILTPQLVISSFSVIALIFIPIGLAALSASDRVVEIVYRYDRECIPEYYSNKILKYIRTHHINKTCNTTLTVPTKMKSPVFIYYELDHFYQNYRPYVKSRSDKQLLSKKYEGDLGECKAEAKVDATGEPVVPCGLIAWSLFNDTYSFSVKDKVLNVSKENIAWKSDKQRFGSDVYPKNFQASGLIGGASLNSSVPLSEQHDLMVWMRTAPLPKFRKLYGTIETDLEANDVIDVTIMNNYNSYSYGGKKKLILSTTTWIGGKNSALAIAYLTIGGLCILLALVFLLIYIFKPRNIGDPSYLSWNKSPAGYRNSTFDDAWS